MSAIARDAALAAHAAGLCALPPRQDGSKAPMAPGGEWVQFQTTRPDENQLRSWYGQGLTGVGVVCGAVSGDLEMFEFEGRAVDEGVHTRFEELAQAAGLGDVVQRIFDGYCETTPSGGIHLLYQCPDVGKPKKLARRPSTPDEFAAWKAKEQAGIDEVSLDDPRRARRQAALDKIVHLHQVPQVLIETKGEGGYTIVAPSNGTVHPNGGAWEIVSGSFTTIAVITAEERAELHRLAAMLDELPKPPAASPERRSTRDDNRPGDEYNAAPDAAQRTVELLEAHGWTVRSRLAHVGHEDTYLRRPGKDHGVSGLVHMDNGTFVNWSTSVVFDQEVGYSPFSVLAALEHAGDYSAAAKDLRPHGPSDLSDLVVGDQQRAPTPIAAQDSTFELDESLQLVDLGPVLAGTIDQPTPTVLTRDDGRSLFYEGMVNGEHADSGIGKGWLAALAVQQNARVGRRTLIIDLEDTAASWVARLLALGMTAYDIERWVMYVRPAVELGPCAVEHLRTIVVDRNVHTVIIDSLGEAFGLAGVDENKDAEVGPWMRNVARVLSDTGAAVILIDHATKANDNPLHPSGSKRKRAAIGGASYLLEAITPFVKGEGGRLRLTCAKDRHGNYRRGEIVADLVMDNAGHLVLYAPTVRPAEDADVPTVLAARAAVAYVRDAGREVTRNELEGGMAMKASAIVKRGGIDHATALGSLVERHGSNRARLYTYVHDLDQEGNS